VAEKLKIADLGDIVFPTHKIDKALERLAQVVEYVHEQNVIPIVIGGGHHISIGSIGGIARSDADKTLGITVVDAHCDFRESEDGKIHSGIPFRYLRDKYPSISGKAFVEFGLRPERNAEKYIREMEEWGASLYHLDEETPPSPEELLKTNGYAENIFLSIDIDAFDIRGASAPYPGGLPAGTGREIAYRYGKNDKVTGMDVVEVNPHIDYDSSDLAAQLIWSFLAGLSERKNG
jgi:arginase family enzyme